MSFNVTTKPKDQTSNVNQNRNNVENSNTPQQRRNSVNSRVEMFDNAILNQTNSTIPPQRKLSVSNTSKQEAAANSNSKPQQIAQNAISQNSTANNNPRRAELDEMRRVSEEIKNKNLITDMQIADTKEILQPLLEESKRIKNYWKIDPLINKYIDIDTKLTKEDQMLNSSRSDEPIQRYNQTQLKEIENLQNKLSNQLTRIQQIKKQVELFKEATALFTNSDYFQCDNSITDFMKSNVTNQAKLDNVVLEIVKYKTEIHQFFINQFQKISTNPENFSMAALRKNFDAFKTTNSLDQVVASYYSEN